METFESDNEMRWFAAHAILGVEFLTDEQLEFPVWENVYLISANSEDEAWKTACARAKEDETFGEDDLVYDGHRARLVFRGVRKVVACQPPTELASGMELTYSFFVAASRHELELLISGKPAKVLIEE